MSNNPRIEVSEEAIDILSEYGTTYHRNDEITVATSVGVVEGMTSEQVDEREVVFFCPR